MAATVRPMLAKLDELPVGDGWLYEVKWDGFRCTATVEDGQVTMQSRSSKSNYVERFPEIAAALATLPDCVIDGEIVTMDENGDTFGIKPDGIASLIVFDVLSCFGTDTRQMPLTDRRRVLTEVLALPFADQPRLAISPEFDDGEKLLEWAAERGIEGIVAKLRSSRYVENSRSAWVKVKVRPEQEFVVVGWVPGKNGRTGRIGGLLLGYYDAAGELVYAGRTGNLAKFDREMEAKLAAVEASPLGRVPKDVPRERTWVQPELVVQVAYQRWSDDRRLQHPSLKRIRDDKDPRQVTEAGLE